MRAVNKQAYTVYKQAAQPVRAISLLSTAPAMFINLLKVATVMPLSASALTLLTCTLTLYVCSLKLPP